MIETWWKNGVNGRPRFALAMKIKTLKLKIKEWAKNQFGDVGVAKKNILEEIQRIDIKKETCQLTEEKRHKKLQLKEDCHRKVGRRKLNGGKDFGVLG